MRDKTDHFPFLDAIRGVAILGVFMFHSLGASFGYDALPWEGMLRDFTVPSSFLLLYPFTYGNAGVVIFFLVSGFCIHLSYSRSRDESWCRFAYRRFFRIYPPYLLAVCIFFFLWPWGSFQLDSFARVAQLVTHLLAVHNLDGRTFYLIHQPILKLVKPVLNGVFTSVSIVPALNYAVCLACYPIILLLSWVMYRYVERPSIALGKTAYAKWTTGSTRGIA